jgi:hypothetical protein
MVGKEVRFCSRGERKKAYACPPSGKVELRVKSL